MNDDILNNELSKMPLSEISVKKFLSKTANIKLFKALTNYLKNFNEKVDFIFIDGGHKIETIKNDWLNCKRLLKKFHCYF